MTERQSYTSPIERFKSQIRALTPDQYSKILRHDIRGQMGNISSIACSMFGYNEAEPTFSTEGLQPEQKRGKAIEYIQQASEYMGKIFIIMREDTVRRTFNASDKGKEILVFTNANEEFIPIVLASTQCLLDPTEENLTQLRSMSVTCQSLGVLESCIMGSLPDQPMHGIGATVASGLIRNAATAARGINEKPKLYADNINLVIENLSKNPFPKNYTDPGVSGTGGTGMGMTIINAFADYGKIKVTHQQSLAISEDGPIYRMISILPLATILH